MTMQQAFGMRCDPQSHAPRVSQDTVPGGGGGWPVVEQIEELAAVDLVESNEHPEV